jgi:hypothetical protein
MVTPTYFRVRQLPVINRQKLNVDSATLPFAVVADV